MESLVFKTPEEAVKEAAAEVAKLVNENPIAILGLSAGKQFIPFYKELVRWHRDEGVSMHKFRSFQTTEYLGMPGTHPMSNRFFLGENFFDNIPAPRRYQKRLPGLPVNLEGTIQKFEQRIKSVDGINLLVLTVGPHGQLGFNEKGTPFDSRTRMVFLSDDMREEYKVEFPRGAIPRRGLTMGIATILDAQRIIVLVTEMERAEALGEAMSGKISPAFPASALRKHPNVQIYTDKKIAVAAKLPVSSAQ